MVKNEPMLKQSKPFLKVWVCMGEENDLSQITKTIEDIQVDVKPIEIAFNVFFVNEVQELLMSIIDLSKQGNILSNSQIGTNWTIFNEVMMGKRGYNFDQDDLIVSRYMDIQREEGNVRANNLGS
jgi:hypothetical protein